MTPHIGIANQSKKSQYLESVQHGHVAGLHKKIIVFPPFHFSINLNRSIQTDSNVPSRAQDFSVIGKCLKEMIGRSEGKNACRKRGCRFKEDIELYKDKTCRGNRHLSWKIEVHPYWRDFGDHAQPINWSHGWGSIKSANLKRKVTLFIAYLADCALITLFFFPSTSIFLTLNGLWATIWKEKAILNTQ